MAKLRGTAVAVLGLALLVGGCSHGGGSGPASAAAKAPATSGGPCDKATFAAHAGLAGGAVHQWVWKPFQAGSFRASAKGAPQAMAAGGRAGTLASHEFASALAVVKGCPSATTLVNALTTGVSLSASVGQQLSRGTLNTQTVGGTNSIVGTVSAEARNLGITVTDQVPTAAQLTAGH
jgi:hypothetical protein